ncbi:MAG: HD-GYP domain-containing protein [Phycisphaerae bacterium]|jgi:putative nucleotidyltransferase with HDIG domain
MESTQALVAAVDARDPYTRAHSVTVAAYADAIARHMNIPARTITTIRAAGLLHDIGKIGVPDAILTKPGPLDDAEFALMKRHPQTAVDILGHVSFLREERPLILHHHERFDGNGYPAGLSKERIPLGARVLAVADALETMLSARSYKAPFAVGRVRDELVSGAGSQFDPNVVDATLRWLDETPTDLTASDTHYEPRPLNTTEGEP